MFKYIYETVSCVGGDANYFSKRQKFCFHSAIKLKQISEYEPDV